MDVWVLCSPLARQSAIGRIPCRTCAIIGLCPGFSESIIGEDIGNVFGPIPQEAYLDSIRDDLLWILQDENHLATLFYGVLNACRVFMVLDRGPELVPSKEEAALWALDRVPTVHHALIRQCLAWLPIVGVRECGQTTYPRQRVGPQPSPRVP
ncbi:MAG: DUF4111 domain-containing protein [Actinobacteria bacterium]|nr:DUF4111 domain-containing protein [Actinomycetota bacterium]